MRISFGIQLEGWNYWNQAAIPVSAGASWRPHTQGNISKSLSLPLYPPLSASLSLTLSPSVALCLSLFLPPSLHQSPFCGSHEAVATLNRGFVAEESDRLDVEEIIEMLEMENPNPKSCEGFETGSSPLAGRWQ